MPRHGISMDDYDVAFRGGASSKKWNTVMDQINHDLVEAFRRERKINEVKDELVTALTYENAVLESQIAELQEYMIEASGAYAKIATGVSVSGYLDKFVSTNYYTDDSLAGGTSNVEMEFGQAVLPVKNEWSHVPVQTDEDGEQVAGSDITLYANTTAGDTSSVDATTSNYRGWDMDDLERDDPIYHIIDKRSDTIWTKEFDPNDTNAPEWLRIRVSLPAPMDPQVNTITIRPFPDGIIDIDYLKYYGVDGSWHDIPGWPQKFEYDDTASTGGIKSSKRMHFCFDAEDYNNAIELKIRPVLLTNPLGLLKWVYGFKSIDIGFIDWDDSCTWTSKLDAPTAEISYITGFKPIYGIYPSITESLYTPPVVRFEIWNINPNDDAADASTNRIWDSLTDYGGTDGWDFQDGIKFDATLNANSLGSIFIRTTLRKVGTTTPVVKKFKVYYI